MHRSNTRDTVRRKGSESVTERLRTLTNGAPIGEGPLRSVAEIPIGAGDIRESLCRPQLPVPVSFAALHLAKHQIPSRHYFQGNSGTANLLSHACVGPIVSDCFLWRWKIIATFMMALTPFLAQLTQHTQNPVNLELKHPKRPRSPNPKKV
jgi:hypothetical protein